MRRKSVAIVLSISLVVAIMLGGCSLFRRSATPPLDVQPAEEEAEALVQEASENTEEVVTPATTVQATEVVTSTQPTQVVTSEPTLAATVEVTQPVVIVPTPATSAPTPEPTVAGGRTHVVQAGENLFRIALNYGLTTEELAKANNITDPTLIKVGQVLVIPATGGSMPPAAGEKTYIVKAGDTLYRIAVNHNVDVDDLAAYNGITNPALISVGQVIRIP